MGKLLTLVWFCKVFLTGYGTVNACSTNGPFSIICMVSEFYFSIMLASTCFTFEKQDGLAVIQNQEIERIRRLEEGLQGKENPEKGYTYILKVGNYIIRNRFQSKLE